MPATYDSIATTTISSTTSSVTFSSISGSYTDLVLVIMPRGNNNNSDCMIRFNSDTAGNYNYQYQKYHGDEPTNFANYVDNATYISPQTNINSTNLNPSVVHIMNYSNTTNGKAVLCRTAVPGYMTSLVVGHWRSTAAITSITLQPTSGITFESNSVFTLYGITKG